MTATVLKDYITGEVTENYHSKIYETVINKFHNLIDLRIEIYSFNAMKVKLQFYKVIYHIKCSNLSYFEGSFVILPIRKLSVHLIKASGFSPHALKNRLDDFYALLGNVVSPVLYY